MTLGLAIVQARGWGLRLRMIWILLTKGQLVLVCPVMAGESMSKAGASAKGSHLHLVSDEEDTERFDA